MKTHLTGQYYFEKTFFGLVLYVEWFTTRFGGPEGQVSILTWKKAKQKDLKTLGL